MTVLENGSEVNHNRKGKTPQVSHAVESGFRLTIKEITKGFDPKLVGKSRRTGYSNVALHIKRHAMAWADGFPRKFGPESDRMPSGFTPAVRDVFKRIVWAQDMGKGYAAFSYETLGAPTKTVPGEYHHDTVRVAVNWLRAHGLIQSKTGRGWGRDDRRNLANQYVPNFWIFIDPDTGLFVDPPYHNRAYDWRENAMRYRDRLINGAGPENPATVAKVSAVSSGVRKGNGARPENPAMVGGENRRISAEAQPENPALYNNTGGGAPASPASADATADCATAPRWKNEFSFEVYAQVGPLAHDLGVTLENLMMAFAGFDMDNAMARKLTAACREHDRWMNDLTDPDGVCIDALTYYGQVLDDNEEEIEPGTIVWATDETIVVTGDTNLKADTVMGIRYRSAMTEAN